MHCKIGDHLKVSRGLYTHHGIYAGEGEVIHFSGELKRKQGASIRRAPLSRFAAGGGVEVIRYANAFSGEETVARAARRIGERGYSLLWKNCEHFARWCRTGEEDSEQVRDAGAATTGTVGAGAAVTGGLSVAAGLGTAAGLAGGAGLMTGLATVGGVVGAGAAGGIALLAAAPAAAATGAMRKVLRDDPHLSHQERKARRAGRVGTVVGAGLGTAGTLGAVAAAGVPGLSAAGLTSGLASIGTLVGGGMTAGLGLSVAAPTAAAVAAGYGVYRLAKWLWK